MVRILMMLVGASAFAALYALRAFVDGGRVLEGIAATIVSMAFLGAAALKVRRYVRAEEQRRAAAALRRSRMGR